MSTIRKTQLISDLLKRKVGEQAQILCLIHDILLDMMPGRKPAHIFDDLTKMARCHAERFGIPGYRPFYFILLFQKTKELIDQLSFLSNRPRFPSPHHIPEKIDQEKP